MNKMKRILALLCIIILIGLYLTSFIASLMNSEFASKLFLASFFCTIFLPIMIYGYILASKAFQRKQDDDQQHHS